MNYLRSALLLSAVAFAQLKLAAAPAPVLPSIPTNVFRITDHGAVGDGKALNTKAIRETIAAAVAAGGGVVLVPEGRFVTQPFELASKINFRVDKGAILLIDDKMDSYPMEKGRFIDSITAKGAHDLEISGEGTIDGQGKVWWDRFEADKQMPHRPYLIRLVDCERLRVRDIHIVNSQSFHLVPQNCIDVTIDGITIKSPANAHNTDGIDPSGWNFLITNCTIDAGDDNIAIKPSHARQPGNRNYTITNCRFLHGHGMSIGSGTDGGIEDILVKDCLFDSTDAGLRIKTVRGRGGVLQNITYENITMNAVKNPIYISDWYPERDTPKDPATEKAEPVTETTPINKNIFIRNMVATNCPTAGSIRGLPEAPVTDVTLSNVIISAKAGMKIIHAKGIHFINSKVTSEKKPTLTKFNAEVMGLE
jgi:polygalacturonase